MKKTILLLACLLLGTLMAFDVAIENKVSEFRYEIRDGNDNSVIFSQAYSIAELASFDVIESDIVSKLEEFGDSEISVVFYTDGIVSTNSLFISAESPRPDISLLRTGDDSVIPSEHSEPMSPMDIGLTIHGGDNTRMVGGLIIGGVEEADPVGNLDIRGDEGRFWDGSGTVNYANAAGDLFVEDQLEVDGTIYGANWRSSNDAPLIVGADGIAASEDAAGQWTISGSGMSADDDWTIGSGIIHNSSDQVAIGTSSSDGHELNVEHYSSGYAAVRGVDQGSYVYAEGMLGVLDYSGLPDTPYNIGVLGIKPVDGGDGAAVYGLHQGNESHNWAIYGVSNGSGGTNYGIYGAASGGTTNYAGYFDGDVHVADYLGIGTTDPSAQLHTTGTVRHQDLSETTSNTKILTIDDSGYLAWRSPGTWMECTPLWSDDFEDASLSEYCATTDFTISTTRAHSGIRSGRQTGGSGSGGSEGSHGDGASICFSGIQPEYISFWIYPTTSSASQAYFTIEDGSDTSVDTEDELTMFFYKSDGDLRTIGFGSTYFDQSASINTWHRVEYKNIDWDTHTFDVYYNGSLNGSGVTFRGGSSVNDIDRIFLYNYNSATAYYDDIWIGDMCGDDAATLFRLNPVEGVEYTPTGSLDEAFTSGIATLDGNSVRVDFSGDFIEKLDGRIPVVVTTAIESADANYHISETTSEYFIIVTDDGKTADMTFNWIAVASGNYGGDKSENSDNHYEDHNNRIRLDENGDPIDVDIR